MAEESGEKEVVVVGPGYMGKLEAETWRQFGRIGFIVDKSAESESFAKEIGGQLVVVTEEKVRRNFIEFVRKLAKLAKKTDVWNISSPTELHGVYMGLALRAGVRKIFVEKPSTDNPLKTQKILKRYPEALIQVDYIERGHPVVQAIKDEILQIGFKPKKFFNWRSKDLRERPGERYWSEEVKRFTFRDLVHDISEIDFLLKTTTGISLETEFPTVVSSKMKSWQEKYGELYPWQADVEADFTFRFSNGVEARIRGDADSDYRRYFVVYNDDVAFFGQTLEGKHLNITPVAAKVEGKENIEKLVKAVESGNLKTNEDFERLFAETNATVLDLSSYDQNALNVMIGNLYQAKSSSELISPLSTAAAIEEVAVEAYKKAGREHFLDFKVS